MPLFVSPQPVSQNVPIYLSILALRKVLINSQTQIHEWPVSYICRKLYKKQPAYSMKHHPEYPPAVPYPSYPAFPHPEKANQVVS